MATISLTLPVSGTVITAGLHSTNYTIIQNAINGGLDNNNINASAAISQSKIAFDAWQAYTPVWTSSGTPPALGNGTLTGRYVQIGKTVMGRLLWTAGSTTTFGTGFWSFTLPVTAAAGEAINLGEIGTALAVHTGVSVTAGFARIASTTTLILDSLSQPSANFSNTVPYTWASTDTLAARFMYEAA